MLGDGLDDAECGVEVGICAFYFLWDFAGVHAAEGGEDHGDAEQCPGESVGAGVVEVSVEFFHSLLFFGEVVVEFLLLDEGEAEPYCGDVLEVLVESLYFGSEVVKDFFERVLGVVAGETVEPFVGC